MKFRFAYLLITVLVLLLCGCGSNVEKNEETSILESTSSSIDFVWPLNGLLALAPEFCSDSGIIHKNTNETAIVEFCDVSIDEFNEYKNECEEAGFIFDAFISDEYYIATNENGYVITVVFSNERLVIEVDVPYC